MSLQQIWEAAASSPFEPSIAKDSQLYIGFLLLITGLFLAGLFGLNRSLLSLSVYGIPASLCFGYVAHKTFCRTELTQLRFGAVYTICGAGVYV
jgi:hypothetical protein